jgi:hypothetical protein
MKVSLYGQREPDGRRRLNGRKTYDVKKLWQNNHEIINLAVTGMKEKDIARALGCSIATVSNTLNSTLGKEKLALMRGTRDAETWDHAKQIMKVSKVCLDFLEDTMLKDGDDSAPLGLKVNISKHVLKDLSGLAAPTRIEGRMAHAHLTLDEIEELKRRGRQAAAELDNIEVVDTS